MTHTLTIIDTHHPGRPPLTMNEWRNAHWTKKSKARTRIHWQIRQALQITPIPMCEQVTISITQYAPDARIRDADGLSAFRKDAIDALRRHVVPDDAQKHVIDGGNTILLDRENPRIEIRIEPTPTAPFVAAEEGRA